MRRLRQIAYARYTALWLSADKMNDDPKRFARLLTWTALLIVGLPLLAVAVVVLL